MSKPALTELSSTICVAVLGTCDTKLDELLYVRKSLLETHGVRVKLFDVGRTPSTDPAVDVPQPTILATRPRSSENGHDVPDLSQLSRNEIVTTLAPRAARLLVDLVSAHSIHGLISLGGSGGSSFAAEVFDALPLGFPKLLVSTMAAGDVGPFVRDADVAVMYSVVDIAGINDVLSPILENAAGAIAGMAHAYYARTGGSPAPNPQGLSETKTKTKRVAITMFGVTTPAVTHARTILSRYACTPYVFHATGAGGRTMERLIGEGFFDGVLDLTTTELADELVGGTLSAGAHRLEAAASAGIPQVVSLGALDMVNFGPMDTVPEWWKARGRRLHEHNPSVTVMRTSEDECAQLGRIIAEKLRAGAGRKDDSESASRSGSSGLKTEVWIPRGGVSALSVKGGPFEDQEADAALFRGLKEGLQGSGIPVVEKNKDINDPEFAEGMVISLANMMQLQSYPRNVEVGRCGRKL